MPPEDQYENVAEVLTGLSTDSESHTNTEQQLQQQIDQKQNILTARFPLKIQDDVISLGFLSTADAEQAAIERAAHLQATVALQEQVAELNTQVEANKVQIARLEADLAQLLAQQPPSSKY